MMFGNASKQPVCAKPGVASLGALSLAEATFLDLLALPRPLVVAIFALLPVDTRLRCSEVSRAWRAFLVDTTLWACLNLSSSTRCSEALLRAAVAKAGGQLRALDTGLRLWDLTAQNRLRCLREVVTANAATLTELRVESSQSWIHEDVRALLEAPHPLLKLLTISMYIDSDHEVACAILRNEPPFQAVRLRRLGIHHELRERAAVITLCSGIRFHASLEDVTFSGAVLETAAAMVPVVDACILLRLRKFMLVGCRVAPATLPELTRLIAAGALRDLCVHNFGDVQMFDQADEESTQIFVAVLQASAMTRLRLVGLGDLPRRVVEAAAFINERARAVRGVVSLTNA